MKIKNVVIIVILAITLFTLFSTKALAIETQINPDNYKSAIEGGDPVGDKLSEKTKTIVSALTTVGIVISVLGSLILGIKYMMGSVEAKVEYKKSMLPMFIGLVLLFTISTVVSIIYSIMNEVNGSV